jgi:hypothetical protein
MNDSISSLVGVDDSIPEQPENVKKQPTAVQNASAQQADAELIAQTQDKDSPLAEATSPNISGTESEITKNEPEVATVTVAPMEDTQTRTVVNEPAPTAPMETEKVDAVMDKLNSLIGAQIGETSSCKVMIYSDPGQGKSSIAGTVPNSLAFDFEDGLISAAESPHGIAPGIRPMPYVNFVQAEAIAQKLAERNPSLDWVDVFTIDTYSDFTRRTLADICERDWRNAPSAFNRYKPNTDQYTENNEMHDRYVRTLRDLDRDLLILCHAKTVEPKNKPAKTFPDFSESLANKLEAKMDVVGYLQMQEIEGKATPVMITKSTTTDLVHCKRRIDIPDIMIDPTWNEIKAGWQRTQDKIKAMSNG